MTTSAISQMSTLTETLRSNLNNRVNSDDFDLHTTLDNVLGNIGLSTTDSGGKLTFYGKDPIVPSCFRFGSMAAIAIAAKAMAAAGIIGKIVINSCDDVWDDIEPLLNIDILGEIAKTSATRIQRDVRTTKLGLIFMTVCLQSRCI
jgi:hypothetical protein